MYEPNYSSFIYIIWAHKFINLYRVTYKLKITQGFAYENWHVNKLMICDLLQKNKN